jgi:hypothetical protein
MANAVDLQTYRYVVVCILAKDFGIETLTEQDEFTIRSYRNCHEYARQAANAIAAKRK